MVNTLEAKPSNHRFRLRHQTKAVASLLHEEFGIPFTFYDAETGLLISESETAEPDVPCYEPESVLALAAKSPKYVCPLEDGRYRLAVPLFERDEPFAIAVGVLSPLSHLQADRLQEQSRLEKWTNSVVQRLRIEPQIVPQNIGAASDKQAENAWNSVLMLDKLFRRLRVHKDRAKYRQKILDAAAEILNVQTVFWISPNDEEPVIGGEPCLSPWDCQQLAMLIVKGMNRDEIGVRVYNDVQDQPWASRCKNVSNLCVVAVNDSRLGGWAIAVNKRAARKSEVRDNPSTENHDESHALTPADIVPFRRSDAAALVPYLSLLGLYSSASHRYHTLKELMVGLARSLTASIDAKDEYTFGHSERVARISMELGSELGLDDDELNDIYLAGLLHDIGKIGVPDAVLRKPGALTPEETLQIQQHPVIGHKILSGLRPIAHLLPGVLYHHERYDGAGYPEGLKGEAIPMLARIIAVADGYDAMSSSRPYRQGMPLAKVEQILEKGAGTQWDANVIQAFFRRRQRIHAIRHHGVGESLRHALDAAIRENDDSKSGSSVATLA